MQQDAGDNTFLQIVQYQSIAFSRWPRTEASALSAKHGNNLDNHLQKWILAVIRRAGSEQPFAEQNMSSHWNVSVIAVVSRLNQCIKQGRSHWKSSPELNLVTKPLGLRLFKYSYNMRYTRMTDCTRKFYYFANYLIIYWLKLRINIIFRSCVHIPYEHYKTLIVNELKKT